MTRAFIVHISIDDNSPAELQTIADDIEDDLVGSGYDVERVEVWNSPGEATAFPEIPPQGFVQPPIEPPPLFP